MKTGGAWDSLIEIRNRFAVLILSGLIDVGFVLIWLFTQWLVSRSVIQTPLVSSLDRWMVQAFQVVFAISTMVPVALYAIRDITIGLRKWAEIRKEIEPS